jgi:hypothetical protein
MKPWRLPLRQDLVPPVFDLLLPSRQYLLERYYILGYTGIE